MNVAFWTLGCKVNQFDTAVMQAQAKAADCRIVAYSESADVYVINTCSVTGRSNAESRQMVRRALKTNPNARVVVTGCYAQTHPDEVARIEGVSMVLGTRERIDWLARLGACESLSGPMIAADPVIPRMAVEQPVIETFEGRTRFILKVQDGCDFDCSFCIIPRARGPSRSVPAARLIEQVNLAMDHGYREMVLTGVNLGLYGRDFSPKESLAGLLTRMLAETPIARIRLSSLEPKTVTPELIRVMGSSDRFCSHFHIPLQSGDPANLARMNRHYTPEFYAELIRSLARTFPDAGFGTDVLVGFPGETETHFDRTFAMLSALPFGYIHAFTYSSRPLTVAAEMRGQVPSRIKADRTARIRALSAEKDRARKLKAVGRSFIVLLERHRDEKTGLLRGYTDNYLRVLVPTDDDLGGQAVPIRLMGLENGELIGLPEGTFSVRNGRKLASGAPSGVR